MFVSHPPSTYDLFLTAAVADGIKLWDLRTNRCVRRYDGHVNRSQPVGVAFSPCARFIAAGSEDRSVSDDRERLGSMQMDAQRIPTLLGEVGVQTHATTHKDTTHKTF